MNFLCERLKIKSSLNLRLRMIYYSICSLCNLYKINNENLYKKTNTFDNDSIFCYFIFVSVLVNG